MREDPIIFEDWKIGRSSYINLTYLFVLDFMFSFIIGVILIINYYQFRNFFVVFLWFFLVLILFLIEVVLDQKSRGISDRILVLIGIIILLLISNISSLQAQDPILVGVIVLFLSLKFVMIPIVVYTMQFFQEILIPNNEDVRMVLDEHISRLEETDYRVESSDLYKKLIYSSLRRNFLPIGISFLFVITLYFLIQFINPTVFSFIGILIVLLSCLIFTGITSAWYLNKFRKEKITDDQQETEEDLPIFPYKSSV